MQSIHGVFNAGSYLCTHSFRIPSPNGQLLPGTVVVSHHANEVREDFTDFLVRCGPERLGPLFISNPEPTTLNMYIQTGVAADTSVMDRARSSDMAAISPTVLSPCRLALRLGFWPGLT